MYHACAGEDIPAESNSIFFLNVVPAVFQGVEIHAGVGVRMFKGKLEDAVFRISDRMRVQICPEVIENAPSQEKEDATSAGYVEKNKRVGEVGTVASSIRATCHGHLANEEMPSLANEASTQQGTEHYL